ncbi:MAG: hypothetical protein KY475_13625 [Planctomycetes bacterium]|nr:hypothetical protein [Planctomycetota bacterium]
MATEHTNRSIDLQEQADGDAVLRHAFQGEAVDPDVARRVRERAAKVTEEIRRLHGIIDDDTFHALLHDEDDEP